MHKPYTTTETVGIVAVIVAVAAIKTWVAYRWQVLFW